MDILNSGAFALNETDVKKWLINTAKYFAWVILFAVTEYLKWLILVGVGSFSLEALRFAVSSAIVASVVDITHRYLNNNQKPL